MLKTFRPNKTYFYYIPRNSFKILSYRKQWYKKDDNALPSLCVLQTISKLLPDYLSHDPEKKKAAKNVWWNESEALQKILIDISQKELGEQEAMKYIISITHLEVLKGVLECSNTNNQCLWFKRTIKNIENVEPSWQLSRYIECLGQEKKWQNSRRLLNNLKQKMMDSLPSDNIHEYIIPWTEKGVDPSLPEHMQYLQQINEDFERHMMTMIDKAIVEREQESKREPLLEECLQHLEFCRKKSQAFGRVEDLQKIKSYLQGPSKCPFIVHATSGSGKTTLMAMAASRTKSWLSEKVSVIMRFVGTTYESTDIIPFLQILAQQIKEAKGQYAYKAEGDIKHILSDFQTSLQGVSPDKPIVLYIDALDQFNASNGARELFWLPKILPDNVKLVVSTLEDPKYECFRKLKVIVKEDTNILQLRPFTKDDVHQIINGWLENDNRTLTSDQRLVLVSAFNECPLALFLKLSYDTASTWASYYSVDQTSLEKTVRASINKLFQRLEVLHGKLLTSKAFGYLTAAKIGLSEAELEDILSCDDDVLNDVYMYWTPPVRRLPPLLLVRLKASLEDKHYLVERGVDGLLVMYWYHRQFSEAAYDRYCGDTDIRQNIHAGLADFFSGTWAQGKKKPYTDRQGISDSADRQVAEQPFQNGDRYNTRKLKNLAYHRIMSGDLHKTKQECLCNFYFLLHRLKGTSIRQLLEDFEIAVDVFPSDKAINQILYTLRLSESALLQDGDSLVSQILGRLPCIEETEEFLQQCKDSGVTYIKTNRHVLRRPGGQLKYALHGDDQDVLHLDMTQDGKTVVTSATSNIVKLWDVLKGKLIRNIEDLDNLVRNVNFINNDTGILVRTSKKLITLTIFGDILYAIPIEQLYSLYAIGGVGKTILCLYRDDCLQFYDLCNGSLTHSTTTQGTILTDPNGYNNNDFKYSFRLAVNYGTDIFIALIDNSRKLFTLVDLESKTASKFSRVFQDNEEEESSEIDAIAITRDNKYVIVASMAQTDLILYDTKTLEKVRVIPGNKNLIYEKFKISNDGKYLYCPCKQFVLIYNLETWERTVIFRHSFEVINVCSVDMKTFVTICGDYGLWIWNKDGEEDRNQMDGFIGTTVSYLSHIPNSYYVVTLTSHRNDHYIQVHDVVKKIKVRQSKIHKDQKVGGLKTERYCN
ncbi:NACHT and WD repeat domain-containing protein 2-like [Saccostrea echinata]|uniref:NACHT and WD repeat domain-containing protein 2-like n=1 Tax=Saccostrea echinata TaxID=191078 RepID=UPI002A83FFD6|nr:NACHT and WD repeat domain-containing protein 2-like [Saccostrea echinata]